MNQPAGAPFDKNMFLAIALALVVYLAWQSYLTKKYPEYYAQKAKTETTQTSTKNTQERTEAIEDSTKPKSQVIKGAPVLETKMISDKNEIEKFFKYEDETWSLELSSRGMGFSKISLSNYTDRKKQPIFFQGTSGRHNFSTHLVGRARDLHFDITQVDEKKFTGVAQLGTTRIVKTIIIDSSNYTFKNQIRVENPSDEFSGLTLELSDRILPPTSSFFLMPSYDFFEFYTQYEATYDRDHLSVQSELTKNYSKVNVSSLSSQYFALAVLDQSSVLPDLRLLNQKGETESRASAVLSYLRINQNQDFTMNFVAFAGPKSYSLLESIDPKMSRIVNFGFFESIARVIFKVLAAIHGAVGNWGLAIILLTILVRILVLPFNLMSYKSMKGMVAIQPELKILREKYKSDPQKLNQEMLKLMKDAKANPIGGCLPMLLQIPVFFALFQVLSQSIELYKAPFILWIQDLSYKDPFFVLPILMGVTLFVQQKITPTTMEPAQQKIMLFMPVIFSALMLTLPSGLTLYIFVSGLFAVIQQYYFMKSDKKPQATK